MRLFTMITALILLQANAGCRRATADAEDSSVDIDATSQITRETASRQRIEAGLSDLELFRVEGVLNVARFGELARKDELRGLFNLRPDEFLESLEREGITFTENQNLFNAIIQIYCYHMARTNPVALVHGFQETDNASIASTLAQALGTFEPELAIDMITGLDQFDSYSRDYWIGVAVGSAAKADTERAIRVLESLKLNEDAMEYVVQALVSGQDAETIGNQGGVKRINEIVNAFSPAALAANPEAIARFAAYVAFQPMDAVLEVFPIDGEPWQRMGAMTYLKAFAPVGTPGSEKVGQFLDSDQAVHLTPVERAELEKLRGGFFPSQQ
jgi:hypothetical protein